MSSKNIQIKRIRVKQPNSYHRFTRKLINFYIDESLLKNSPAIKFSAIQKNMTNKSTANETSLEMTEFFGRSGVNPIKINLVSSRLN